MSRTGSRRVALAVASFLPLLAGGCILAAAGAGAGGAIYLTDRGAESLVTAPVDRAASATRQAFTDLGIRETKSTTEREGGTEKRQLEGQTDDREITVSLRSEDAGTRVDVVARRSRVTWDKDFARAILEKIVAHSQ